MILEISTSSDFTRPARSLRRFSSRALYALHEKTEVEFYELVLAGGLFRSSTTILVEPLVSAVRVVSPDVRPIRLVKPPVVGAVLLAFELAGFPVEGPAGDLIFSGLDEALLSTPPERI
jgi:hypothetical protein